MYKRSLHFTSKQEPFVLAVLPTFRENQEVLGFLNFFSFLGGYINELYNRPIASFYSPLSFQSFRAKNKGAAEVEGPISILSFTQWASVNYIFCS